jgi:hypothetical protein
MNFDGIKPFPVTLRQSSAACAMACERKWFLKYRLGVTLRGGEFHESAELGTIFHRLMLEGPGNEEMVREWLRTQQVALVEKINAGGDLDGTLTRKANKMFDLFNTAQAMAQAFWEKYPDPPFFQVLGKEITHECEYQGVLISGTIDKLLLDTRNDQTWIRDYKSTGRGLVAVFAGAAWRLQGSLYRILAEDWLRNVYGSPINIVRGFILDGIVRPGIKLCKTDQANAQTWKCGVEEAYLRRVKEWYAAEEGKRDDKIMRSVASIFTGPVATPELKRALMYFADLQGGPIDPERYCRDVTGRECFAWERECPYHSLCGTNPDNWDQLFESKYAFQPQDEETGEAE